MKARSSFLRRVVVTAVACFVVALPLAAETFTVKLRNGRSFVSRYKPQEPAYDKTIQLFLTDVGNWIAVAKDDITEVVSETESKGFGYVIDTTTIALGWAPNDAPSPEEVAAAAEAQAARGQTFQAGPQAVPYSQPLFSEPNATGGLPLNFLGSVTPPLSNPGIGQPPTRNQ